MEPLYRQRLIGAMVLVSVAVVVVPLLLGEPRPVRDAGVEVEVPEPPRFEGPASPEQAAVAAMEAGDAFPDEDLAPPAPSAESLDAWLNPGAATGAAEAPAAATAQAPEESVLEEAPASSTAPPAEASSREPKPSAQAAAPAVAAVEPAASSAPADDAGGGVWVVQVGSFGELDNARRRVEQLQSRAFEAWVAEPEQPGGPFRVWVGPELERARADELQARITRELGIDARVKRHVSR